jgi:broad specificity phosphatase PhoE
MSRLILIRHAQATFSRDPTNAFRDYDKLSSLGEEQAERLAEELVASGTTFTRVLVGPATRHRETAEAVGSVYAGSACAWPELMTVAEFGEHQGARVVERALADPGYHEKLPRSRGLDTDGDGTREYLRVFRRVTRRWARGELPTSMDVGEDWQAFRARVERGVSTILQGAGSGETVGVFTSGGPIGATVAWVLGLGDEAALELAWMVENATLTELLFTDGRASLHSFNVQPRIGAVELHTYV